MLRALLDRVKSASRSSAGTASMVMRLPPLAPLGRLLRQYSAERNTGSSLAIGRPSATAACIRSHI